MPTLAETTAFFDSLFSALPVQDFSNNGLQVEASQDIQTIAFAVDACQKTFTDAAEAGADLLFVHHGLSWGNGFRVITGRTANHLRFLFGNSLSLYASHLPLDAHPQLGNNAGLANLLNLQEQDTFFPVRSLPIGRHGFLNTSTPLNALADFLDNALGTTSLLYPAADRPVQHIGIVSGGGADAIDACASLHIDALVTGEFEHQFYHQALELGISVIAAGHYATETIGPRLVMEETSRALPVQVLFIDAPTGL